MQLVAVFRIGEKRDLPCPRGQQRTDLRDEHRFVTVQHPTETGDDIA